MYFHKTILNSLSMLYRKHVKCFGKKIRDFDTLHQKNLCKQQYRELLRFKMGTSKIYNRSDTQLYAGAFNCIYRPLPL